jgi:hypothetical protein
MDHLHMKALQCSTTCMGSESYMGGFEGSTHLELESMGPSSHVVFPLAYFCGE